MTEVRFGGYDAEAVYKEQYRRFTDLEVPPCGFCGSPDTASVQVGVVGITIQLAATCRKFRLIPNGPKPGTWYCHACKQYFDVAVDDETAVAAPS